MKHQKITGLWVGDSLPLLAQLCIQSFLDHGHEFQLFTYKHYANIPPGATVRDAREILPEEAVFYHENGSLAPFADWFRNEFLVREGGYWTDLDVACLSDDFPGADTWFCLQEKGLVAVGVVAFPPHHPLMEALRTMAEDPAAAVPWDSQEETAAKKQLAAQVPDVVERRRTAPWGHCGPEGFTRVLRHFDMLSQAACPSRLYPLHYTVWRKCYNGDCHLHSPELQNAWAIHLWGEMLRHEPDAFENVSRSSIVGELLDRHLPGHEIIPTEPEKKKLSILVGICSCNGAPLRRAACRETWLSHPQPGIECRFFLGRREPLPQEPDAVNLWVDDGYASLPAKGLAFYKWALDNYDFDWLFKCDDDTYIALDRLASLCDSRYDLIGNPDVDRRKSPSGGAGYFMSRRLVELIVAHADEVSPTGAEDLIFGAMAVRFGVPMLASPRLILSSSPAPRHDNDIVTCHWCSPERLRDVELMFHAKPIACCSGKHPYWQDDVLFFSNGRFMRRSSGCMGWYSICPRRELVLRWDRWPVDRLQWKETSYCDKSLELTPTGGEFSINFIPTK